MSLRRAAAALLLLAAAGCAAYKVVAGGEVNRPLVDRLYDEASALRELPFARKVPMRVYTKDQLVGYLEAQIAREYTAEDERGVELALRRLGLLEEGRDYFAQVKDLIRESAAGFYDPEAKEFRLIEDFSAGLLLGGAVGAASFVARRDFLGELVVVHELTHVLQDQHFDLLALLPPDLPKRDDDRFLARKTVVETEANVVGYAHLLGVDLGNAEERGRFFAALEEQGPAVEDALAGAGEDLPKFLVRSLAFQYFGALGLVGAALDRGGWSRMNAVWEALPRSTEQLLWPEKYLAAQPDEPRTLAPLGEDFAPLRGWKVVHGNTLGELGLRALLEERLEPEAALRAARGWGGDRFEVAERDGRSLLLWRTLWDSEADAAEFADAYGRALDARRGDAVRTEAAPRDGVRLRRVRAAGGEEFAAVQTLGDAVTILEGAGAEEWDGTLRALAERNAATPENALAGGDLRSLGAAPGAPGASLLPLTGAALSLKFAL